MPSEDVLQAAAAAAEKHTQSLRGVKNGMPKLCSDCMCAPEDGHGYLVEDRSDGTKMLFCGLRCLAVWAMQRGWRK